jgi:hypothetical protein
MSTLANGDQNLKGTQSFDEFTFVVGCVAKALQGDPAVETAPVWLRNTRTLIVIQYSNLLHQVRSFTFT